MNDRHPSGAQPPTGSPADASYAHYPAYDSYAQQAPADVAEYGNGDPLFGSLPGSYETGMYDTGTYDTGMYDTGTHSAAGAYGMSVYGIGSYGTDAYDTGTYPAGDGYATGAYDTGSYASPQWDTGAWETGGWDTGAYAAVDPHASDAGYDPYAHTTYDTSAHDATAYASPEHETAGYDATAYGHGGYDTGSYATGAYDTGSYATGAYEAADSFDAFDRQATALQETASYEATAIWSTTDQDLIANIPAQAGPPPTDTLQWDSATWNEAGYFSNGGPDSDRPANDPYDTGRAEADEHSPGDAEDYSEAAAVADAMTQAMPITPAAPAPTPAPAGRRVAGPDAGKAVRGRGRRRTAKRSALLTVAVPSVAAMGVCAAAAAAVTDFGGADKDEATTQAAPDAGAVKPAAANNKLDTQLAGLSASADDFRDRASRTQERIDLKERQAQERKRKVEEAARKEAARPKFLLPVKQHGLSAQFGQAGVNWMSLHTGIDFPVSYGTPVMSATDGTVRTQWNSAYGNMAIVTAPDGTETWYCHLSSTKIRSGSVKAGDQIAYSGNSGNSTGPHLHFEVRPGGGAAVDPLPWLRDHGLDPN
ncbi:peptidoglycan DD-metalloendopeptidase family protein [Streptomyces platensis]|uniref:M23 family metallopeptidase n=1 Tax=Streptomyces platensis TaxID=58346 RepID=UPI002E0E6130|nr:peptidoglycan DD-metalloendopeptidase family protein [Streptomyces platensis]